MSKVLTLFRLSAVYHHFSVVTNTSELGVVRDKDLVCKQEL